MLKEREFMTEDKNFVIIGAVDPETLAGYAKSGMSVIDMLGLIGVGYSWKNYKFLKHRLVEVKVLDVIKKQRKKKEDKKKRDIHEKAARKPAYTSIFTKNSTKSNKFIKRRLIEYGLKKNICEICEFGPTWMEKPLSLHLHHKNGEKSDMRVENLQLLCPNCRSQLENGVSKILYKKKNVFKRGMSLIDEALLENKLKAGDEE